MLEHPVQDGILTVDIAANSTMIFEEKVLDFL
jgi:hypothetical protein